MVFAAKKSAIAIAATILAIAAIWYAWKISTFSSLSASDAKWWTHASELVLLISTVLLTAGLIGEWSDSESWKKRLLYKGAKAAVILGVVGELLADGGIFEAGDRVTELQDIKIIALETPRVLRDPTKLSAAIRRFPDTPYVWVQVAEMEVIFERAFLKALQDGGWKGDNAAIEGDKIVPREELAAADAHGIRILYDSSRANDFKQPSEALRDGLIAQGLNANAGEMPNDAGLPPDVIHIQIGTRG